MDIVSKAEAEGQGVGDGVHAEKIHELFRDTALIEAILDIRLPHEQRGTRGTIAFRSILKIPGPNMLESVRGAHVTTWRFSEQLVGSSAVEN